QAIIAERSRRLSDDELLEGLRHLYQQRGYLSGVIIDETEHLPSSSAYQTRFGSLLRAYQLVGFTPARDYRYMKINRELRRLHPAVIAATVAEIKAIGAAVTNDPVTDLLAVNDEFTASIVIARCRQTPAGALRWHIHLDSGLGPDITV